MSADGIMYGQGSVLKAACLAACQNTPACKQAVWYNSHCYPMNAASKVDSSGDNAGYTSYQCSSTTGRQCTTKTSTRSKYLGAHVEMSADGITYGQAGVTLARCTDACEKTPACKQAVWDSNNGNNVCYPMNIASDMVEAGSNDGWTSVHCGAPTAPVKNVPKSSKSCAEHGWNIPPSTPKVCGASRCRDTLAQQDGGGDIDYGTADLAKAKNECERFGARLCTKDELKSGVTKGTGCNHNSELVWSSTSCEAGKTFVVLGNGSGNPQCKLNTEDAHHIRCCADA
jgi:hypothetical protein